MKPTIAMHLTLSCIFMWVTSCSSVKIYERYGVRAYLYENETKLAQKKVKVRTAQNTFSLRTDREGAVYLAPKSEYQMSHLGDAFKTSRVEQRVEIEVDGYRTVSFNYHRYLPERSSRRVGDPIREIDGVLEIGNVRLDPQIYVPSNR